MNNYSSKQAGNDYNIQSKTTMASIVSSSSSKSRFGVDSALSPEPVSAKRVSLLELERESKKRRRKSGEGVIQGTTVISSSNQSSKSLASVGSPQNKSQSNVATGNPIKSSLSSIMSLFGTNNSKK